MQNSDKTHCPEGHAYDEANTYVDPRGSRQCRECRRAKDRRRTTTPEQKRRWNRTHHYRSRYGLSPEAVAELLDKPCELCKTTERRRLVDHDHATGKVRGALCVPCNTALGALGDNAEGIRRALDYVS